LNDVPLRQANSTPDGKRRYRRRAFATIANRYDLIAVLLSYLAVVGTVLGCVLHGEPNASGYIPETTGAYPGAAGVVLLLQSAGFGDAWCGPVLGGSMAMHQAMKNRQGWWG